MFKNKDFKIIVKKLIVQESWHLFIRSTTDLWENGVPALIGAPKLLLPPDACDLADDDEEGGSRGVRGVDDWKL